MSNLTGYVGLYRACICLAPGAALASGDPAVLWWAAGAIVMQMVVGVLLWRICLLRTPVLAGYGLLLMGIWLWGLNVPGPDFGMVHAVLLGAPVLYLLGVALTAMVKARLRKQPE